MKVAVCVLGFLAVASALPTNQKIDWSKIRAKEIFITPTGEVQQTMRVIGGTEATAHAYPYQAAVIIDNASFCGGSLIAVNYVLTAAHCTSGATSATVILGAHNIQQTELSTQTIQASALITHENYNGNTIANDIALIRLKNNAILNEYVKLIPLATSGDYANTIATLTGWGRVSDASTTISPTLQTVDLSVITNTVCQASFGSYVQSTNVCSSGQGNKGGCNGDSGGPLVNGGTQIGIVSFGSSKCQAGAPTVYTRVTSFTTWIKNNAK